jgi:CheY-like chemotaxis protein
MKILVTDDSKMARKMVIKTLQDALNDKNYEVLEAQNGQESVDLYKEHNPNIVFMDLTMPVMDGFEALKQIKSLMKMQK